MVSVARHTTASRMQMLDKRLGMQQEEVQWFPWLGTTASASARTVGASGATAVRPRRATTARRAARARDEVVGAAARTWPGRVHQQEARAVEAPLWTHLGASQGLIAAAGHPSPGPLKACRCRGHPSPGPQGLSLLRVAVSRASRLSLRSLVVHSRSRPSRPPCRQACLQRRGVRSPAEGLGLVG